MTGRTDHMCPKTTRPIELLTREEVGLLLRARGVKTWTARRDRALIITLYRAGLRLAEALALRPVDVDRSRGAIRVLYGKGGRARTVGIDPWGLGVLGRWLDERETLGFEDAEPVFCTASGRAVGQGAVRRMLPRLASKANIAKRVHAHGFRHAMAAELRAEGIDLAVIRRQLGHASLLTTVRYLDHLEPESVVGVMAERG